MSKNTKIWIGILGLLLVLSIVFAVIVANPAGGLKSARDYTITTPTQNLQIDTGIVKITTDTADNMTPQYSSSVKAMASLIPIFFVIMILALVLNSLRVV